MHYWEAGFPDQPIIFEIGDDKLQKYEDTITDLISLIFSLKVEQFERTINLKKCAYCEYQSYHLCKIAIQLGAILPDFCDLKLSNLPVVLV